MRGRYEVADLIKLRDSPLSQTCPPSLPPKEEWMGSIDPKTRLQATRKNEETFGQSDSFQKRPTLFESRRSTTDPERIHLGPPRNSFASSNARTRNHERTKTGEDEKNGAPINGKHHNRADTEHEGDKPRRRYDEDDLEARPRGDYARPRWGARDSQADAPWTRRDQRGDNNDERPAWRRGARDNDRIDEPEWADTIEPSDAPKKHTQDDLAQWMAQMKNKDKGSSGPLVSNQTVEKELHEQPQSRVVSDTSADKFFARFAERSASDATPAAKPTKSRFASLFGSKDEPKSDGPGPAIISSESLPIPVPPSAELEQPPARAADHEKKAIDQAAFNNVLAMLQRNSISPNTTSQATKTPVNIAELATSKTPTVDPAVAKTQISRTPSQPHTPNLSLDRLLESRSPAQPNQQARSEQPNSAQQLLNLLQQKPAQPKPSSAQPPLQHIFPQYAEHRMPPQIPPGFGPPPSREQERPGPPLISTRREAPRSIFDDPAFAGYQREQEFPQRSPPPGLGGMAGLFASVNDKSFAQNGQEESRPSLHRPPPGFENAPRPPPGSGWPANPPRQYNGDGAQAPYGQSRTAYPQPQSQPAQPMPQRKPTGGVPPGFPNIPPGFGPSPTYAAPGSPESDRYARGGYGPNERGGERERVQQPIQYPTRLPMNGAGVQVPPGFR